jgi:DNA-binding transcriptional ArsR family regulator
MSVPSTGGDRAEVVFSDDDLARVRMSSSLELVSEVIGAAHRRHTQEQPTLRGWEQRIGDDLGPIGAQILQDLRSGVFLIRGLLTYADIDTDLGFDDRLEVSLARPSSEWADPLLELRSRGIPVQPGLAEGRPAALEAISGAARRFHNAAVAPYWDHMSAAAVGPALAWMQTMSTAGLEALFNGLHPAITWRRPALSITADWRHCGPACPHRALMATMQKGGVARFSVSSRGLTIIPTILSPICLLWFDHEEGPSVAARLLLVPIPITPATLPEAGTSQPDPLADLLGLTRACVLQACADGPLTTTSLARAIGISNSSASEHAAVLRSAGLVVSERQANRVVHRATDIGVALARNASASTQFAASQIHRHLSVDVD